MPQYLYFLLVCTLCSVVFGLKSQTLFSIATAIFFVALFSVEMVCNKLTITDGIYNFWYPVEFGFYSFFVARYMAYRHRYALLVLPLLALIFCYTYYLFNWQKVTLFFTFGYSVCVSVLFIFVIIKIYEMLTDENDLRFPFTIPLFWFLLGLILDLTSFLLFGMKNYILAHNYNLYVVMQYSNQVLSTLQYLCFILYFYCSWKYQNWSL